MMITCQAKVGLLNDPLLLPLRTRSAEDGVAHRCEMGEQLTCAEIDRLRLPAVRLNPPGRHQMTWQEWQIMYINHIDSPTRQKNR